MSRLAALLLCAMSYDSAATVAAFAARLRDSVDIETVQTSFLAAVNRAVEPDHVSLWLRNPPPGDLRQ